MIILDMQDKRPLYEQVVERFKELISRGIIVADEKLPSVRQLAIELSINPNTIQRAYGELERNGFIYSVKGRGNFVADISGMLKTRQDSYYRALDEHLGKIEGYSIKPEEIIEHVKNYYKEDMAK